MGSPPRPAFVLDADFPQGIVQQLLIDWTPALDLVGWQAVMPTTHAVSDEQVIVNAWQRGYQGVISCNHSMLDVPETLAVIRQTKMSVVTCRTKTNKVQMATGALLLNLGYIASSYLPNKPQIWELNYPLKPPLPFNDRVKRVEVQTGESLASFEWTGELLAKPVFPDLPPA